MEKVKTKSLLKGETVYLLNGSQVYRECKVVQPVPAAVIVETIDDGQYVAWDIHKQDNKLYAFSYRRAQ